MPELPEAEHTRRLLEDVVVGKTIVSVVAEDDSIVFDRLGARGVEERLGGRRVCAARRHGKYLWLELDQGPHLVLHLGMTGTVRTENDAPLQLSSSPKHVDRSWPPRFTKLRLTLDDDSQVAFTSARRLARVLFREDPTAERPISRLGFDPLIDMPSLAEFQSRLKRRRRAVLKALLLDQTFAAGVGNWIADEVLFRAKLDPRRRVESLSDGEVVELRRALRSIVVAAVKANARAAAYPKGWLFHRRWRKKQGQTVDGEAIEHLEIAGRTTAWVPDRQR